MLIDALVVAYPLLPFKASDQFLMAITNPPKEGQGKNGLGRVLRDLWDTEEWIAEARAGSPVAISRSTEACRTYMLMIANVEIDADIRRKIGASDIVQEALLTAQQSFESFDGTSEAQLRRWVRQILINKIANTWRFYGQTACRDINREQPLLGINGADGRDNLIDPHPTPRQDALAKEKALAVERTIRRLPQRYQQLIKLRSFEQRSFAEIGEHMNISADAARKAWYRAIDRFRRAWQETAESK